MLGQAYELYTQVTSRMISRFIRPGGTLPGLMCLMSSRRDNTSFLEEHLKKETKGGYKPGMRGQVTDTLYISDYSLWECKDPSKFSKESIFRVEVGDRVVPHSRILKTGEVQACVGARGAHPGDVPPAVSLKLM